MEAGRGNEASSMMIKTHIQEQFSDDEDDEDEDDEDEEELLTLFEGDWGVGEDVVGQGGGVYDFCWLMNGEGERDGAVEESGGDSEW